MPKPERKRIKKHLEYMEWELRSRLNPDNNHRYSTGVKYFKDQIEGAKKLLNLNK